MKRKGAEFGATLVSILAFSFLLNFVWESYHAVFLYEAHDFNAKKYVLMLSYVSVMDAFLILGIYLLTALLWGDMLWLRKMEGRKVFTAILVGLISAAVIEYGRVFVLKTWSYNHLMPTILGIGISPLLQLSATGLSAFWLTKKILQKS